MASSISISRGWSSLTRPGRRPTWRVAMAGHHAANGYALACPHGHWKPHLVAGLPLRHGRAWVLDGPMNGDAFATYVTRVLVPELLPGDIVIMDNLSSHKAPAVRAAIERRVPRSCSSHLQPRLQPDRAGFSKLKAHLHKAAERTIHRLWDAIGRPSTSTRHMSAPTTSQTPATMQTDQKKL